MVAPTLSSGIVPERGEKARHAGEAEAVGRPSANGPRSGSLSAVFSCTLRQTRSSASAWGHQYGRALVVRPACAGPAPKILLPALSTRECASWTVVSVGSARRRRVDAANAADP